MRIALFVVAAALAGAVVFVAPACRRPCETADNCKRTCECVDATTQTQLDCTMAFRCDTNISECEPNHDQQSCAEVCEQYAAIGKCGFQRCVLDQECLRVATCPIRDVNGQPTSLNFQCTISFLCDTTLELCDPGSELPLDQLCFLTDANGQLLCPQPPT